MARTIAEGPAGGERRMRFGPDVVMQLERSVPVDLDQRVHVRALVRAGTKLLVGRDDGSEVYDLEADPRETHRDAPGVAAQRDALAGALARDEQRLGERAAGAAATEPIDQRLKGQLRALGYLE